MNYYKKRLVSLLLTMSILVSNFYFLSSTVDAKESIDIPVQDEIGIKPEVIEVAPIEEELAEEPEIIEEPAEEPDPLTMSHTYNKCLTKRGGVYWNPYTGLKETWYSQRVLPGGGLDIPGRHVNEEGFVCDGDGYICVASSTYSKGTVIETSRGMGKVYDSGCAPGVIDIYTNW